MPGGCGLAVVVVQPVVAWDGALVPGTLGAVPSFLEGLSELLQIQPLVCSWQLWFRKEMP